METYERITRLLVNLMKSAKPIFGENTEWPEMNDEAYDKVCRQIEVVVNLIGSNNGPQTCNQLRDLSLVALEWFQKARRDKIVPSVVHSICNNIKSLASARWYGTITFPLTVEQTTRDTLAMIAAAHTQILNLSANDLYYAIDNKIQCEWIAVKSNYYDNYATARQIAQWRAERLQDLQEIHALAQSWAHIARHNCAHVSTLVNAEAALASLSAYIMFTEKEQAAQI